MTYSDFIVFADESGNPNLNVIDQNRPVFVFSCCILNRQYYITELKPAMINLKVSHFGDADVVLHSYAIRQRKPPFDFDGNREQREKFMTDLNDIITGTQFTVIATAVNLNAFQQAYPHTRAVDRFAFRSCIDRIYQFLQLNGQHELKTSVIIEARGKSEDTGLAQEYQAVRSDNLASNRATPDLEIAFDPKRNNTIGVQLADLSASPIGPHYQYPQRSNRAWDIIEPKLFRSPQGTVPEWGLAIYPRQR